MTLYESARPLPLRHISIRVPWCDNGWTGRVCDKPSENSSCLILPRIRENREDDLEDELAGKSWEELDASQLPPCVSEKCGFMAPYDFMRNIRHPYSQSSDAHKHMDITPFRYPRYSAACIPFHWMLKEGASEKVSALDLSFDQELEDRAHRTMGFDSSWIQVKHNQLVMLDTFFSAVRPDESLCFFYAKRVPLVDETRRVIIGVGWAKHVGDPVEYRYKEEGPIESILWERPIQHSIRTGFKDGFLLPYHEVLKFLEANPEEEPEQFVAFAPDEHFWAFSYGSEHVTNDGAIASLLACAKAISNIKKVIDGQWNGVEKWINERLNELWQMRGPYPGMGAALTAFGVNKGTLLAYELEHLQADDNPDYWGIVDKLFRNPENQPKNLRKYATSTLCRKWLKLPRERRALLKMISRFELTVEQAVCYYVPEDPRRKALRVSFKDSDLLENPYLLYENDRAAIDPISLWKIDRGAFPDDRIRESYPIPEPSKVDDPTDERRVRAFVVNQLEKTSNEGNTVLSRSEVIRRIRELDVQPACPVDGDLMNIVEDEFSPVLHKAEISGGEPAYQLERLYETGKIIRKKVRDRIKAKRHASSISWRERLDKIFEKETTETIDPEEGKARIEKTAALKELFCSRISVLIGPAGTGKTTLLKVLFQEPEIKNGGILALAPTGKARVRLEQQTGITNAQTIAQFLLPIDRYDPYTGSYRLSNWERIKGVKNIIIDEASMLTEEQLAAVLDALSGVHRLVLVGDPRQLPPIGAGRPFLDIVKELEPKDAESSFPRVGRGYAELTVNRRQKGGVREDLLLAKWFSGRPIDPGADEIWSRITEENTSQYIQFIQWQDSKDLQEKLLDIMAKEIEEMQDPLDVKGFEISLGGKSYEERGVFFWQGHSGNPGACAKIENWQILSPVRNSPHGVEAINRLVQATYRYKTKEKATKRWRKIPKPMGREEILYGDKVINLKNKKRKDVWPKSNYEGKEALRYVANGEIGIVVGQYKTKRSNYRGLPWKLEVEFASQPDFKYGYGGRDFGEEADPHLELAYALTIHKVQGSEFGLTFLVIPNPCWLLSRELLYTALTRQKNRVVIFHQGERLDLMRYSIDRFSNSAVRLTNLFGQPNPVQLEDRFLEDRLIHRTRRGDSVRSKSEVIIADLLYSKGIDYQYESPFTGKDGKTRYPDFSFEDDDSGMQYYWEHLGLLANPEYKRRWEKKMSWYREQGIVPYDEGGGEDGTLIVSNDDEKGGIKVNEIERLLDDLIS